MLGRTHLRLVKMAKLVKLAKLIKLYVKKRMPWWIRVAEGTLGRKWSGKAGLPEQGGPAQSPLA